MDVSPATELADYVDSRFHGNDKEDRGSDRGEAGVTEGLAGMTEGKRALALRISMIFAPNAGKNWV